MASFQKNPKTGLWSVRYYDVDENGKPIQPRLSGRFKTKKEAQYAYEDFLANKKEQQKKDPTPPAVKRDPEEESKAFPFNNLINLFLTHKQTRVRESSFCDIKMRCNTKIRPFFQDMTMGEITPLKVSQWLDTLGEYSHGYRTTLLSQFCSILSYGEKYYDLPNISNKIERPKNTNPKKEMQIWSPEEFHQFLDEVNEPEYKALFLSLYVLGCREGEILALTWDDIDLERLTVRIDKSFSKKAGKVTAPKNSSSIRTLNITRYYANEMSAYKAWQQTNVGDCTFVFGGTAPLPPTSITRRKDEAIARAQIKRIRIHDFRHSCASLLIHNLVPIVAISKYLGHSSVKETLDTYSHMMPNDQDTILKALESVNQKKA